MGLCKAKLPDSISGKRRSQILCPPLVEAYLHLGFLLILAVLTRANQSLRLISPASLVQTSEDSGDHGSLVTAMSFSSLG